MIISRGSNYDTIQTKHLIIQNVYKQASCPLNKVKKKGNQCQTKRKRQSN